MVPCLGDALGGIGEKKLSGNCLTVKCFNFRRVRDSLNERHVKTRIQQVDAASFTVGVATSYLVEWIVLRRPTMFPNFFYILMATLLINR